VLDTSAVLAYATGSVDVGEPMTLVEADGGQVIVPAVCLIEAARKVDDPMLAVLAVLAGHPAVTIAGLDAGHWEALAHGTRELGRLDLASALLAATPAGRYLLTAEPAAYQRPGARFIIDLGR